MAWEFDIDYKKLGQLAIIFKGGLTGANSGKRLTNKYGTSLEFADFRQYLPGDDIRRIDWSLYGRSQRLYTKLNRSEVDATVNIVVDGSKSMDFGNPHKGLRALELALSFSYISLKAMDRVGVYVGIKDIENYLRPVYGANAYNKVLKFAEKVSFDKEGDLNECLSSLKRHMKPQQVTLVFSDFLSPNGYKKGLTQLAELKQQVWVFHMASPEEIDPPFRGGVKMLDSETGKVKDMDIDYWAINSYKESFTSHCEEIKRFCDDRKMNYCFVNTKESSYQLIHSLKKHVTKNNI